MFWMYRLIFHGIKVDTQFFSFVSPFWLFAFPFHDIHSVIRSESVTSLCADRFAYRSHYIQSSCVCYEHCSVGWTVLLFSIISKCENAQNFNWCMYIIFPNKIILKLCGFQWMSTFKTHTVFPLTLKISYLQISNGA